MMNDPISDMLIRLKNGYLARKAVVAVPFSKIKEALGKILLQEGYLEGLEIREDKFKTLELTLKYEEKEPALTGVKRVSKPGVRCYSSAVKLPRSFPGQGTTIVSTPKGLMTVGEARKKKLGGEIICKIW